MHDNRRKILRGLRFENDVFSLLRRHNIPLTPKKRYQVLLRNGPVWVEPDITFYSGPNLWLISIKTLCRERWRSDSDYEKIGIEKLIMVTLDHKHSKKMWSLYDNIFVLPRDEQRLVNLLKTGEPCPNTLHEYWGNGSA